MADTEFYIVDGEAQEVVEEEEVIIAHSDNLALHIDERELEEISSQVTEKYEDDKAARQDWEQMFEKGFELLGLKLQETSEPFEGACTAVHPLIIENAVKFQSKASQELFPSKGPIKTQVIGKLSAEKEAQAKRVKEFMNYEISEMMPEYFDEFERLLFQLPIFGSAFKKIYFDASASRPTSEFVSVDQFYVPFNSPDLKRADRFTHVIYRSENDLKRDIAADMYRDCDLGEPGNQERSSMSVKMDEILGFNYDSSSDPQHCLLEQHCYLELGGEFETPVAAPYIVTVEENSRKILSVRRNWEEGDPQYIRLEHFVHYKFVPGFGFYGFGYIHFLGNMTLTATAAMRALIDAGQFANLPGGFKARGVRIVGDQDPISPGEWREVESTGQQLDKSFYALPYKEPSATLYQMLDFVTRAGQKFADTTEQVIADSSNYGPVGTTMALIEQSAKFFTAIHKRLHKSQRDEFRVLARVNFEFLPSNMEMDVADGSIEIFKEDFDGRVDVLPVSDPNIPSATHRFALAQMALQLSSQAPQGIYDIREVHRMILEASNIENVDRMMPPPKEPQPQSPMQDIISVSQGLPIKAFPGQNHEAHIAFKTAWMNNPVQQQNPSFPQMTLLIQANISEHTLLQYQTQMMAMLGEEKSADEFAQAQAAQQLSQMAQMAQVGQQQGSVEQQSLDLQKADLELRAQEAQMDATAKSAGIILDNRKLDIEEQKVQYNVIKDTGAMVYKATKDTQDRKTKLIIEYAKFLASLAKNMEIEFSKDSELFRTFPDAFEEVETKAEGGAIRVKDPKTFYSLQDRIMKYQEGGDVEPRATEVDKVKQQTVDRMVELGIVPTSPSALAELMQAEGTPQEEVVVEEVIPPLDPELPQAVIGSAGEAVGETVNVGEVIPFSREEVRNTALQETLNEDAIDDTPNTLDVPFPSPPKPDIEPMPLWNMAIDDNLSVDDAYTAISKAETGSFSDPYIRTVVKGSGSTAFGPTQITKGLIDTALDEKNSLHKRIKASDPDGNLMAYLKRMQKQADLFLLHGGGSKESGVDEKQKAAYEAKYGKGSAEQVYDAKYDYGGSGDLSAETENYEKVAKLMMQHILDKEGMTGENFVGEWRWGSKDAQSKKRSDAKDYFSKVIRSLENIID